MVLKTNKAGNKKQFAALLLKWNREHNYRQMPWKGEKDPYKIWLSEIILQQTRVEQGWEYYNRFVKRFPDIHKLAKAKDQVIFKLWEGLGYYSRCRNLIAAARYISKELEGKFPSTYEEIMALKGVGPYTASAISSFAFNLPHAVVDGNVFRVLSRVFGIAKPIDSTDGKKYFTQLANELLDKKQPGIYNQAIMDFGAVVCKPAAPLCSACRLNKTCIAFLNKKINELPVKEKRISIKKRWFYYLVIEHENQIAIQQRTGKDIWNQLYEFPMMEKEEETSIEAILQEAEKSGLLSKKKYEMIATSPLFKQQLSHQLIAGQFIKIKLKKKDIIKIEMLWVKINQLKKFAFPKFINQYFDNAREQTLF
ncbi:MAG: A/G-specific adenine glycosylase [Chitinophagaceae bacterium]